MAAYKSSRRLNGGTHGRKVTAHQHRRSGGKKSMSKRVQRKLFRGRTVNAPRHMW